MKRKITSILRNLSNFSEKGVKKILVSRFSEKGEVNNYARTFNVRGKVLSERFLKKRKARILDVGCASGSIAFTLAKEGFSIDGIDISQHMINQAIKIKSENGIKNVRFSQGDILEFATKDKYDYVLALFNLLTYFPDKKDRIKALENLIKPLKIGGEMFLDTTNKFGSFRLIIKQLIFKILFLMNFKNRPFGDVYSNPMFAESSEVLYQHYLSKNEILGYLKNINNIEYKVIDYSLFSGKSGKNEFILIIKKVR